MISLLAFQFACVEDAVEDIATGEAALENPYVEQLDEEAHPVFLLDIAHNGAAKALFEEGIAHIETSDAFRQVSWMMDAVDVSELKFKALRHDGQWTDWQPVEITFSEGIMHNALIRLNEPTTELKMRGGESILEAMLEFYEDVLAPEALQPPTSPTHMNDNDGDIRSTVQSSVAPSSLVISRSQWGASNPNKICGNVVRPYRAAIHHTYRPSGDGGDAPARMRQMQSYHMNNLGWCDIGYHFVVAQSGRIYQGRSRSDRPGAHVGGQNSGNVGVSYIADFTSQNPTQTQLNAGADILRWISSTHGFALNRNTVKGHREHSGQSTACPGNMVNHINTLINLANGASQPSSGGTSSGSTSSGSASSGGTSSGSSSSGGGSGSYIQPAGGCSATGSTPDAPLGLLLLAGLGLVALRRSRN